MSIKSINNAPNNLNVSKLGVEKLTLEEQLCQFIETTRQAGAGENGCEFDATLTRIATPTFKAKLGGGADPGGAATIHL